jgi:hypothetical protein
MASFSCRISPRTSTVILRDRSPLAIAVATSAMLRTWPVRFPAIELTLSVRSFHVPAAPGTEAWPPSLPSVPTSRATRVTSEVNALIWPIIALTIVAERRKSPRSGRPCTSSRTICDRSPFATAVIARVTSVVGHSRSSISVLIDDSISPQAPTRRVHGHPMPGFAFLADHATGAFHLARHPLVGSYDFVERVGDLAREPDSVARQPYGEISVPHRLQGAKQLLEIQFRFERDGCFAGAHMTTAKAVFGFHRISPSLRCSLFLAESGCVWCLVAERIGCICRS